RLRLDRAGFPARLRAPFETPHFPRRTPHSSVQGSAGALRLARALSPPARSPRVSRSPPNAFLGAPLPPSHTPLLGPGRRRRPSARSRALASGSIAQGFPLASERLLRRRASLVAHPAPRSRAAPAPFGSLARSRLRLDRAGFPARLRAPFEAPRF